MRTLTTKLLLATGITNIIQYKLNREVPSDDYSCWTESYQNGREQGVSLTLCYAKTASVTISESRNTDMIVVYKDNNTNQGLSEESYKTAKCFEPNDIDGVIEYCLNHLKSIVK